MGEDISEQALQRIHGESNYWKSLAYWIGFLKGVISSGAIEKGELPALKSHCEEFLSTYVDHDAADLIQDLEIFENDDEELISLVSGIINERSDASDYYENAKTRNEFYGFLKGIACDGIITVKEIKKLNQYINTNQAFKEDYRINDIKLACECALEDGVIDVDESEEICAYISKVVGDSYADTGFSSSRDLPNVDGMLETLNGFDFSGMQIVLTGEFALSKKPFRKALEKRGAVV